MNNNFLREELGKAVRSAWVAYCQETGDTKPSHLAPWEELSEWDKEADRRIGTAIAVMMAERLLPPSFAAMATTRFEYQASHRWLFNDYERLQVAAENLANAVVAYFNKRGAAHAERAGNEDIAAMADALSDYGHQTAHMFERRRREEWPAQRLDDAARMTEEP